VELERLIAHRWHRAAEERVPTSGRFTFTFTAPSVPETVALRAVVITAAGVVATSSTSEVQVVAVPDVTDVASFSLAPLLNQGRMVLLRYLRLGSSSRLDAAFANGAATNSGNGIDAVALVCAGAGPAPRMLAAAGISGPVTVDTDADCAATLNSLFDGIVGPKAGSERMFLPSGRPMASSLTVSMTIQAFNIDPARAADAVVDPWMNLPYYPGTDEFSNTVTALDVPVPSNIVRASTAIPNEDAVVQGFWYGCPSCVDEETDYHLQEWADAHAGLTVQAFTCDQDVDQAADYAYEHGWHFPVVVYDGPESFGACFDAVQGGQLHDDFYGQTNFVEGGMSSDRDAACEFPDLPTSSALSCIRRAWAPSADDQIAPYLVRIAGKVDP
jgi:hypothetical protein